MLNPILAAGGILFWVITAVLFLTTVGFMSFHRTGRALTTVIVYVAAVALFTDANLLGWLREHYILAAEYVAGYLALGTLYMLFRWNVLSGQVARIYADIRANFMAEKNIQAISTQAEKDGLATQVSYSTELRSLGVRVPLLVRENKARLTGWLTFWIFSAVEYVLGDLLVNLVDYIVHTFSGFMQNMTNRKFEKFSELN
jgi:hypothetical protein